METYDSAEYRADHGQLERCKKHATIRGLNKDCNHDLKDIFEGAAMRASTATGPLHDFYDNLLAKGRKPTMARLTLARKIARDHSDRLEEGGTFRRQLFETTSSLSASG